MKKYPFKFLDSYNREDKGIFFGRDEEIDALYEMVFQTSVILVYGASGTGKTSLINCGLAGRFQPHDWLPLMIRRGNDLNESLDKMLAAAGGKVAQTQKSNNWFNQGQENESSFSNPVCRAISDVYEKTFRPIYLIFDQFEELFILGSPGEQFIFINTVGDILQSDQPVKLIFSIREEYLGYLSEFETKVPQLLRKKLRIEPMNLEKVTQVIVGIAAYQDSNISIRPGESLEIASGIFNKIKGKGKTLTIQLPFLQVFLDKFYMNITDDESRMTEAEFSIEALNEMEEMDDVLINFLEEQVKGITKKLQVKYSVLTTDLTWKILSPFSTLEGTKEPISKMGVYERLPGENIIMINDIMDAFINSRILRFNENGGMFEIAHDALAKPISDKRSVEEKAQLEIKRLIKSQVSVKQEAREHFTEKQLLFIEPFLEKFKVSKEEDQWIQDSRFRIQTQKEEGKRKQQEELAKTQKRLRTVYALLGFAIIALLAAGYFWKDSTRQKDIAKEAELLAMSQKDSAIAARIDVDHALKKVNEKIAIISKKDFEDLNKRSEIITNTGGCPVEILNQMDSIAAVHPDSSAMKSAINLVRRKCK